VCPTGALVAGTDSLILQQTRVVVSTERIHQYIRAEKAQGCKLFHDLKLSLKLKISMALHLA